MALEAMMKMLHLKVLEIINNYTGKYASSYREHSSVQPVIVSSH